MAIELVEVKKNTRGKNSREIVYRAVGKWTTKEVERETKPVFNEDGTKKLDAEGEEIRVPVEKDSDGKLIYYKENVNVLVTDGVLTDMKDALELVSYKEQTLLDCFVEGYNERAYALEADKDELDDFLKDMEMNDEQKGVFKKTVRQVNRGMGTPLLDAAEFLKTMWLSNKAKAAAAVA